MTRPRSANQITCQNLKCTTKRREKISSKEEKIEPATNFTSASIAAITSLKLFDPILPQAYLRGPNYKEASF
jgi:hypothetical protein